jgi:hypothetical protein
LERIYPFRVLVGKPEGKRLLGRPRHRWKDNIKVHIQEIGRDEVDYVES